MLLLLSDNHYCHAMRMSNQLQWLSLSGTLADGTLPFQTCMSCFCQLSGVFPSLIRTPIKDVTPKGVSTMSTEDNKACVRRAIEALNRGDMVEMSASWDKFIVPDFVRQDTTGGLRSREEYKRVLSNLLTAIPGQFTIEDLFAEGEKVLLRYTFHGTHQGQWRGIPPTGKPVTFTGMLIYRFDDGKIVEGWENADILGLLQQLGAVPAPGQAR
jgi:steroid delta-isomerase-like uncharacterized protein